jgi:transcriptional antiterminator RfaH
MEMQEDGNARIVQSAWAVVNTQPHREYLALENLERQGFIVYCPSVRRRTTHARRTREVLRPLFPGYLFVHVSRDQQHYRPILSTLGVKTLVHFGGRLAYLEKDFVQELKSRETDGAIVLPPRQYKVGQEVRLEAGPFAGLVGAIVEMDEKERIVVLMHLLNRPVKVKLATAMIVPA